MNSTPPCYRCSTQVGQHSVNVEGIGPDGKPKNIRVCMNCAYPHEIAAAQKAEIVVPKRKRKKYAQKAERQRADRERNREREELWKKEKRELEVLMVEMDKHLAAPIAERCKAHEGRKGIKWRSWGQGFDCTETQELDPLFVVEAYYWKRRGKCAYCDRDLNFRFHIEHMTPTSRGGTNQRKNITVSCASCNDEKGTMTASEYTPLFRKPKKSTKTIILRKKNGQETRKVLDTTKPKDPLEPGETWWHDSRDIFEELP